MYYARGEKFMADLGDVKREIYVEPLELPAPLETPAPQREPMPVPELEPTHARA